MEGILSVFREAFSNEGGKELSIPAIAARAIFVFIAWLVIIRLADRRMLGKYSAFDTVLGVMIGAVLGRTINGGAPLWGSLTAVAVLVTFHWVIASVSHRWRLFGRLVKGEARELVADGRIDEGRLRKSFLTENDLKEMLRLHGRIGDPSEAKLAMLERNGQISALPREKKLRVVDVQVEGQVQTVRLEVSTG
jgi:uncharacterized membrane protein YcaP (DUF421 family)